MLGENVIPNTRVNIPQSLENMSGCNVDDSDAQPALDLPGSWITDGSNCSAILVQKLSVA